MYTLGMLTAKSPVRASLYKPWPCAVDGKFMRDNALRRLLGLQYGFAFTAITFEGLREAFCSINKNLNRTYGDDFARVARSQILDFRCQNPDDGRISPPKDPLDPLLYLNENYQWNVLPGFPMVVGSTNSSHKEIHVEIQYKRVAACDLYLARQCGVGWGVIDALRKIPRESSGWDPSTAANSLSIRCGGHKFVGSADNQSLIQCLTSTFEQPTESEDHARFLSSHIYIVRLVATMPQQGTENHCVILRSGGWVVPSKDERFRMHKSHASVLDTGLSGPPASPAAHMQAVPRPYTNPRSNQAPTLCKGDDPETWIQLSDPTQEDLMWMAWKLLTGTTYRCFREGAGVGLDLHLTGNAGLPAIAAENPFQSPSRAAFVQSDLLYKQSQATRVGCDHDDA